MAGWRWVIPFIRTQNSNSVSSVSDRKRLNPQDRSRTVIGISLAPFTSLIVIHWPHRPCSASWWFDRVSKKPSVKADMAIYSRDVPTIGLTMIYCKRGKICWAKLSHFSQFSGVP